jgi:hypothetical protein
MFIYFAHNNILLLSLIFVVCQQYHKGYNELIGLSIISTCQNMIFSLVYSVQCLHLNEK